MEGELGFGHFLLMNQGGTGFAEQVRLRLQNNAAALRYNTAGQRVPVAV